MSNESYAKLNSYIFNSSPPGQNGRHFTDDTFGCIFVDGKFCILIEMSLKFPKGSADSNPIFDNGLAANRRHYAIMPLSEPMLTRFTDAYMRR